MTDIIFGISYYLVWFIGLYLVVLQKPILAFIFILFASFLQGIAYRARFLHRPFIRVVLTWVFAGFLCDGIAQMLGLVRFEGTLFGVLVPWILGMWVNFGLVCLIAKARLYQLGRFLLPLAALGFPLAYGAGIKIGVAHTDFYGFYMLYLACFGGFIFPWLFSRTSPKQDA